MPSLPQPLPPNTYRVPIPVTAVAFSPDGNSWRRRATIEFLVWNGKDGPSSPGSPTWPSEVYSIQYSPDGKLIAVAAGTPAQLGRSETVFGAETRRARSPTWSARATRCLPSPSARTASDWRRPGPIGRSAYTTWRPGNNNLLIEDHADWVMDLAWLPDGSKMVSASRDKTAKVFDARTGDSLVTFNGHAEPVFGVATAPDGKTVITSGRDKNLRRWNVADAKEVQRITGFGDEVFRVGVTQDGRIFSCSADRKARMHSLADGKLLKTFSGHSDWVYSLAYNEATKRLATGSFDGEVRLWNVQDGKGLVTFLAAPGYKRPVANGGQVSCRVSTTVSNGIPPVDRSPHVSLLSPCLRVESGGDIVEGAGRVKVDQTPYVGPSRELSSWHVVPSCASF